MKIDSYHRAGSPAEAYELLAKSPDSAVIGGGAWMKLMPGTVGNAIDLSGAGLGEIREDAGEYSVGAMVTLRQLETYPAFTGYFGGIIPKSAGAVMGVAVRNIATVGGTIAGRYGFSDLLPALVALDAEIEFFRAGRQPVREFISKSGPVDDVLTHIYLKKTEGQGWFETIKNTAIDFPILNAAVTGAAGKVNIVVGARPYKAACCIKAMEYINGLKQASEEDFGKAAELACEELKFGSNQRGSAEYRKELARTLVARGLKEVLS